MAFNPIFCITDYPLKPLITEIYLQIPKWYIVFRYGGILIDLLSYKFYFKILVACKKEGRKILKHIVKKCNLVFLKNQKSPK